MFFIGTHIVIALPKRYINALIALKPKVPNRDVGNSIREFREVIQNIKQSYISFYPFITEVIKYKYTINIP